MRLDELFDKPLKWEILTDTSDEFDAQFEVGDYIYTAGAKEVINSMASKEFNGSPSYWEFGFNQWIPSMKRVAKDKNGEVWRKNWEKHEEITGTGNAASVYSTVAKILHAFLKAKRPKLFRFSAKLDEPTKRKLYRVFAQKIAKKYAKTYELSTVLGKDFYKKKAEIYWFTRKIRER
jgi:hypothetical protein